MRVLAVQNYRGSGLGQIEPALDERGVAIDLRRADLGEALPSAVEHDAMIVLGGAQNALDDAGSPHFPGLLDLMRRYTDRERPVLGICLGAQLLARAFGAENRIGAAPEFGWREIGLTPEGRGDALLGRLPDRFVSFQWHDDTFSLPEGATRLAENRSATNQAFRMGRASYGVQFHFEADRALVRRWSEDLREHLSESQPGWEERREAEAVDKGAQADAAGARIARAFVDLIV